MELEQVQPEESLTRYILHKSHFSILHKKVKYAAFLPAPTGATSVFRTSLLSDAEIWQTGEQEVADKRNMRLLGRADVAAFHILHIGLRKIPDNEPPRHANITGWPEEISEQKLIALELAEKAQLYLK